jgi:AraC-like DNA-binding protein
MEDRPTPPGELLTRLGSGAVLPDVLRDLGVEPRAVYEAAGLDISRLADPDAMIPLGALARLIRGSLEASGRSDLGLLVAGRAGAQVAGLLGQLFHNADDLRSALHGLIRYGHLNHRNMVPILTVSDNVATLQFALAGPFGGAAIVSEDATIGGIFIHIRAFMGATWRPSMVLLSHAPGSRAANYRRFFCAPVRFNAVRSALEFPAADLDRPATASARDPHAEIEAAAASASTRLSIAFEEQVRWLIRARLADPDLSVEQIAALTGLSRRSLNRRLEARGVTVASLLRSVRFAIAQQLLVESETPLSEVAAAIGYAEPSIFSTAFRRWSGVSPREWRKQHGRGWAPPSASTTAPRLA